MLRQASRLLFNKEKYSINHFHIKNFKNFGHKKQPVPRFTFYWHGFLTFSFIGLGIEWKRIGRWIFDEDIEGPIREG